MAGSPGKACNLNFVTRQLYFWAHTYSPPKWRNLLAWIVGCMQRFLIKLKIVLLFLIRRF